MSEAPAENERAVIGDNRKSFVDLCKDLNADLLKYLAEEHADMMNSAIALQDEFETAPAVVDTDDAEKVMTDLGGRLSKFIKSLDRVRTIDKAPTLEAGRLVDTFFANMTNSLAPRMKMLERRVNAYKDEKAAAEKRRREEAERVAREQAAEAARKLEETRRAAEAESDEAARKEREHEVNVAAAEVHNAEKAVVAAEKVVTKGPPVTTVRAESGTQSVQATRWVGEITDIDNLDLNALRPFISVPELEKAVRQYALRYKDTRPLTGAKISEKSSTSFKG